MTEQDMIIQDLRRENENLRAELERKQKEIELASTYLWFTGTGVENVFREAY